MNVVLKRGDCLIKLKELPDNSVDAVVSDPPYGLAFMGKRWDYDVPSADIWREALRVLKPGGHLLAFGGTRTYHRLVVNVEDAGFEVRDMICWHYGSGFPKSMDISKAIDKAAGAEREILGTKDVGPDMRGGNFENAEGRMVANITAPATPEAKQWSGWGTALKPATEPIVVARKPLSEKTVAANVLKWGVGGLNIDASRIGAGTPKPVRVATAALASNGKYGEGLNGSKAVEDSTEGRWPANVIFDEAAAAVLDQQSGVSKSSGGKGKADNQGDLRMGATTGSGANVGGLGDVGGASRFFYVAKASKKDRNGGCEEVLTWENVDRNLVDHTVDLSGRLKATFADGIALPSAIEWSTLLFGNSTTDPFLQATMSTTSTASKTTTVSGTLLALADLSTSESIQDAIRTFEANGLSLADAAENISRSMQNTTDAKTVSLLGAARAVLLNLSQIRGLAKQGNVHSTVKPTSLMEYLVKLVTPEGGTVLDPFMGSGTTGVAAVKNGYSFIGCEMDEGYLQIAAARIRAHKTAVKESKQEQLAVGDT